MKTVNIVLVVVFSTLFAVADESKIQSTNQIGDYVQRPDAAGFLRYSGEHCGVRVYALSVDTGSAVPSEDFRLYAIRENHYQLILSLPMLSRKGYRCTNQGDTLSVHVVTKYEEKSNTSTPPVVVINLSQLVTAHAEQAGAGQPATKPAEKPPVKDQPTTPMPKDVPR